MNIHEHQFNIDASPAVRSQAEFLQRLEGRLGDVVGHLRLEHPDDLFEEFDLDPMGLYRHYVKPGDVVHAFGRPATVLPANSASADAVVEVSGISKTPEELGIVERFTADEQAYVGKTLRDLPHPWRLWFPPFDVPPWFEQNCDDRSSSQDALPRFKFRGHMIHVDAADPELSESAADRRSGKYFRFAVYRLISDGGDVDVEDLEMPAVLETNNLEDVIHWSQGLPLPE